MDPARIIGLAYLSVLDDEDGDIMSVALDFHDGTVRVIAWDHNAQGGDPSYDAGMAIDQLQALIKARTGGE